MEMNEQTFHTDLDRNNIQTSRIYIDLNDMPPFGFKQLHRFLLNSGNDRTSFSRTRMKTKFSSTWLFKLIIALLFIALWDTGHCQPADSLISYLEIAARNNPSLLQQYAEYEAALQKIPQAASLPDPEISFGVFLSPMEIVTGKQVADIRLMQMFPWFGVLKKAKDEMSMMAKAKYETFYDTKLQLFYDIQRSWYDMNKIRQNILLAEKNLELLNTIERLAITRFKAGSATTSSTTSFNSLSTTEVESSLPESKSQNTMSGNMNSVSNQSVSPMAGSSMNSSPSGTGLSDVYRIRIEIGEMQNNIELLKSQLTTKVALFNSYLGRPLTTEVAFPDSIVEETAQPYLLKMTDSILNNNPMLGMVRFEQQSLDAREQMITKMGYPMIGIGVNYSLVGKDVNAMTTPAMNGRDMIMPMVTATLPVYRKKYKAMREEVNFLKSANKQKYNATLNSLESEYYQALQLYNDAERRKNLYSNQLLLVTKSMRILVAGFASSGANLTEILSLQQQSLDYEFKKVEAITDYNTSLAWLQRLTASTPFKQ
jgi:outer membrane protein TolC